MGIIPVVDGPSRGSEGEQSLRRQIQALHKKVRDLARLHDAACRLRQAESLREGLAEMISGSIDQLSADMVSSGCSLAMALCYARPPSKGSRKTRIPL